MDQEDRWAALNQTMDDFWLITMGTFVFLMQAGFAFLEAGSVRPKNTTSVLLKNVADALICGLAFWSVGWAFSFSDGEGDNAYFIGYTRFFTIDLDEKFYALFFFQYVFAATAVTIVGGAMAERTLLPGYLVTSAGTTAIVYPFVAHWVWTPGGWLNKELEYVDFAGSSVVHVVGGATALVGAAIVGPRIGRFSSGKAKPMPGHSTVLVTLGLMILWFGFFAFNAGSVISISTPGSSGSAARAAVATALAASSAGISSICTARILTGYWSLLTTVNGILCGCVAICAGANVFEPWAAFVVGAVAGVLYVGGEKLVELIKVDDPLNAVAVHLIGGLWGIIAVALLATSNRFPEGHDLEDGGALIAWTGNSWRQVGRQLAGVGVILVWVCGCAVVMFLPLRLLGLLRADKDAEIEGLDYKDGQPAYPADMAVDDDFEDEEFVDDRI